MKAFSLKKSAADLILISLIVLATGLFMIGYNFGLPILTVDEGWIPVCHNGSNNFAFKV